MRKNLSLNLAILWVDTFPTKVAETVKLFTVVINSVS
jgi:hypothetical protein